MKGVGFVQILVVVGRLRGSPSSNHVAYREDEEAVNSWIFGVGRFLTVFLPWKWQDSD